jgi:hypothetical protein
VCVFTAPEAVLNEYLKDYNIGSTVCLGIHPSDPSKNRPRDILRLRCGDVGEDCEDDIPSLLPRAVVTWHHTSLSNISAYFAIEESLGRIGDIDYTPPDRFTKAFPGLVGVLFPLIPEVLASTESVFDFDVRNVTSSLSDLDYLT